MPATDRLTPRNTGEPLPPPRESSEFRPTPVPPLVCESISRTAPPSGPAAFFGSVQSHSRLRLGGEAGGSSYEIGQPPSLGPRCCTHGGVWSLILRSRGPLGGWRRADGRLSTLGSRCLRPAGHRKLPVALWCAAAQGPRLPKPVPRQLAVRQLTGERQGSEG